MDKTIQEFQGEYRFLSNFWPVEVEFDGIPYPTIEHAFQAAKTYSSPDRRVISLLWTARDAKRMGRRVTLRPDWEEIRLGIMEQLVRQKFSKEPLRSQLLATGDAELIEGNYWNDRFWGICNGEGENHLGKIIMKIREEVNSKLDRRT